jgi:hypothetical protein
LRTRRRHLYCRLFRERKARISGGYCEEVGLEKERGVQVGSEESDIFFKETRRQMLVTQTLDEEMLGDSLLR